MRKLTLRYGENPHQKDSFVHFEKNNNSPLKNLKKLVGRELSYVNFTDISSGLETVRMFNEPAAVVIKHNSPSGIALGKNSEEALRRAVAADPVSAFGGVVVMNSPIDEKTAKAFTDFKASRVQMDIVAAPSVTREAQKIINWVRKTTGIYTFGKIPKKRSNKNHLKFFDGGYVSQFWDDNVEKSFKDWKVVSKVKPTKQQVKQMRMAWKFIMRIRSNSIIVVDRILPMTRGIGSGQTARVFSTEIALKHAGKFAKGGILASDSFFPFPDSVELAAKFKIGAIVQQGGSMNDQAAIEAADKARIPMVFTYRRAFWH